MEQAAEFLAQFEQAATPADRRAVTQRYQAFLETLSDGERAQVRAYMQPRLKVAIDKNVAELDKLVEQADLALKGKITYNGREYVFGDWVTIADYCRIYDVKPNRVQNWIDREIVPAQNVVVIAELNRLKLLKNQPYQPV